MEHITAVREYVNGSTLVEFSKEVSFSAKGVGTNKERVKGGGSRISHYYHFPNLPYTEFKRLGHPVVKDRINDFVRLKPSEVDKTQVKY